MLLAQQGQVVQAGGGLRWRRWVWGQARLDGGFEVSRLSLGQRLVVEPDFDIGQVEVG